MLYLDIGRGIVEQLLKCGAEVIALDKSKEMLGKTHINICINECLNLRLLLI